MYRFIESIKVEDQKLFLVNLHQKRIEATMAHYGKKAEINIEEIYKNLKHDDDGLYKLRITYDLENNFNVQLIPYAISEVKSFYIVENNTIDYRFKYEDRKELELMKSLAKGSEIIIVKQNLITDSSYSNLVFLKGKQWFTPSSYLLNGVQRQFLLQEKKIKEMEITLQNISEFTHFQIINSLNDFDDMFVYPINKIINLKDSLDIW